MFESATLYEEAYPQQKGYVVPSHGYHLNNKYDGFPPLMSDGRAVVASWQPEALLNEELIKKSGIQSNWKYREYLTHNAKEIMKYNCVQASTDSGYLHRYADLDNVHHTPSMVKDIHDMSKSNGSSDLKDAYLSQVQIQSRMVAAEISK